jgi:hypothetical protein
MQTAAGHCRMGDYGRPPPARGRNQQLPPRRRPDDWRFLHAVLCRFMASTDAPPRNANASGDEELKQEAKRD